MWNWKTAGSKGTAGSNVKPGSKKKPVGNKSPAAGLDPRTKIVMVVCISTLAVVFSKPIQLLWLLAGTIVLLKLLRLELKSLARFLIKFSPLFLFLLIVQIIFSREGEALLALGTVPLVTSHGLAQGSSVILRMVVVIASAVLLATSNPRDLVQGLVQWKVPYEIAFMLSIALRFLPMFREEITNAVTALQLRGVELKKIPWKKRISYYTRLIYPVIYGAELKARQLSIAMEARGFRAFPERTYLRRLQLSGIDFALLLIFPAMTAPLLFWSLN